MTEPKDATTEATGMIALAWLSEMEQCVRAVDYERCRAIFAPDVAAFGTKASVVVGLDALERDQWRQIWGPIRNFTFLVEEMHCGLSRDELLWIACPWTSEGRGAGGEWVRRPGRMTAILERRQGRWLAVHTHHSLAPSVS